LEPSDFCRHWIKSPKPNEWRYRQACIKLLAEATGLTENTVSNWGKDFQNRPSYILNILEKDHIIRLIQQKIPSMVSQTNDIKPTDIEPWDYCIYWIDTKSPDERGFRTECVRELEKATQGYCKRWTIEQKWGPKFEKCPKYARYIIKNYHYHKLVQQKLYTMTIPDNPNDRRIYEEVLIYINFLLEGLANLS